MSNNVEFAVDNNDGTYVATIKIVNQAQPIENDFFSMEKGRDNSPEVINGMDQMRLLQQ